MKTRILCSVAAIAAAALCACTKTTVSSGEGGRGNSWTHPHVLTFSDASDINTLNPFFGQIVDVGYLSSMTMAWLIKWDEHNQPYPELATEVPTQDNGGVSKDGLTITYHLRKGVRWSDGAPFDADDVVFSTNVVLNPANNVVSRQGWDQISKIDEPDKYTVDLSPEEAVLAVRRDVLLDGRREPVRPSEAPAGEVSQHQQRRPTTRCRSASARSSTCGGTARRTSSWCRIRCTGAASRSSQKMIYKIIPDRNTLLSQLQSHELDMWNLVSGAYLASRPRRCRESPCIASRATTYGHLDFNMQQPAVRDPAVREALRLAIDRPDAARQDRSRRRHPARSRDAADVAILRVVRFRWRRSTSRARTSCSTRTGGLVGRTASGRRTATKLALTFATNTGSADADERIELIRGVVEADRRGHHGAALSTGAHVRAAQSAAASSTATSGTSSSSRGSTTRSATTRRFTTARRSRRTGKTTSAGAIRARRRR